MSLREYLQLLRASGWWIAGGLLLGTLAALVVTYLSTPSYTATATLYFAGIEGGGEPGQAYQGSLLAEQKARAYAQLVTSDKILTEIAVDVDETPIPADVITVQTSAGNPIMTVSADDPDPGRAARIVNAIARRVSDLVNDLETPRDARLSTVVTLRTVAPAAVPAVPSSPNLLNNVALGALLGFLLGLGVAVALRSLDRTVRTRGSFEQLTGAPLLGIVPIDGPSRASPVPVRDQPQSPAAESVRQLRANLGFAGVGTSMTILLVASAESGDGRTSVAGNLAAAFALAGYSVLLVDADLRNGRLTDRLELAERPGLSNVLDGTVQLPDAVYTWSDGLFDVLPAGRLPANPGELLASRRTAGLVADVGSEYDVVVVDSSALLQVADATILARHCNATLLLARGGRTDEAHIEAARAALRAASANLVGCAFTTKQARWAPFRERPRHSPPAVPAVLSRPDSPAAAAPPVLEQRPSSDIAPEVPRTTGAAHLRQYAEVRMNGSAPEIDLRPSPWPRPDDSPEPPYSGPAVGG